MIWREFKAMGTDIVITANLEAGQEEILAKAENKIRDFEQKFSRFIETSELSQFNNSLATQETVSPMLASLLSEAKNYYLETAGIFDPTIIGSLEAAGYDRSFNQIIKGQALRSDRSFATRPKMTELEIAGRIINRPSEFRVDLGGLGKGYIIDYLTKNLFSSVHNYWISAGGDIIAAGHQENSAGWNIGVQNPHRPEKNIFSIKTGGQKLGIATSGIIKRSWGKEGHVLHHLIDPRHGRPVKNNILSVTAISSSALRADIFAKTILILGVEQGLNFIEQKKDSAAIIFTNDKNPIFSRQAPKFLNTYE